MPISDMSKCDIIMDVHTPSFGIGFSKGILELSDGTIVNLGVRVNHVDLNAKEKKDK